MAKTLHEKQIAMLKDLVKNLSASSGSERPLDSNNATNKRRRALQDEDENQPNAKRQSDIPVNKFVPRSVFMRNRQIL